MKKNSTVQQNIITRPPIVAVMGHVDHGKSTLLDYIRKTNITDGEVGGITQKLSAYEVVHADENGIDRKITFLDTPGHEAFSSMRTRGAQVADIAILVVSAEDSVKKQTLEAWNTITEAKIPCIVAINKIDKEGANIEKTKMDLAEKGIYIEGYGGDLPFTAISAKMGTGVDELLSTILLVADLSELTGDISEPASGIVIESNRDPKRGVSATLIIKNGTLHKGSFIVSGNAISGTRIIEDFNGKMIDGATFSSPIRITGFDSIPPIGSIWQSCLNKKDAETSVKENKEAELVLEESLDKDTFTPTNVKQIPVIIKADVYGMIEAIENELTNLNTEDIAFKIISKSVGAIGESDIKMASGDTEVIILGFNIKIDPKARDLNEQIGAKIELFDIIYNLTDRMKEEMEIRRPRVLTEEILGKVKILKAFSRMKDQQLVGGRVETGKIVEKNTVKIMRRDFEVGRGKIIGIQQGKISAKEILEGNECGIMIDAKVEIAPGDYIEVFTMTEK